MIDNRIITCAANDCHMIVSGFSAAVRNGIVAVARVDCDVGADIANRIVTCARVYRNIIRAVNIYDSIGVARPADYSIRITVVDLRESLYVKHHLLDHNNPAPSLNTKTVPL